MKSNDRITIGVKTSYKHKRELDLASTNSNNTELKKNTTNNIPKCCPLLWKKLKDSIIIIKFKSTKNKTVWNII